MTSAYHDKYGNIADDFSHEEKIAAVFVFTSPRDWVRTSFVSVTIALAQPLTLGPCTYSAWISRSASIFCSLPTAVWEPDQPSMVTRTFQTMGTSRTVSL